MNRLLEKIQQYRIPLLATLMSVIGVLGFAQTSRADWLPSINDVTEGLLAAAGGLAGFFGFYIANFLNYVMVKLFTFAGYLIDLGITLNQGIMQHGLVRVGWLITRDVANLGFTIGMIAIAFATILRMDQYGVKKLLGKLIFAALLINFSLTIPGVILDGTHVFSKFFMSKVTGDEMALSRFSESIAAAFNIQNLTKAPLDAALNVNNIAEVFVLISSVLFLALFGTLGVIALGATAYMVFYRYMVLTLLFIIAPLAWIALFLPGFSKYWSEWWDTFFKWALFLPFMTFFFYLAIYTTQSLGDVSIMNIINGYPVSTSLASVPSIGRLAGVLGQMVVILGLMVGGLMVSQKMGIAGAAAAVGMATGVKKFALGAIKGAAVGAVKGPAVYLGTRPLKAGAMGLASLLNRPALRWIPGAKGAVAGLNQFGQRQEEIDAYQKQYLSKKALPDEEFKKVLKGRLPEGPVARAALLAEAASRGLLKEIKDDPRKLVALADAAKETNPGTEAKDVKDIQGLLGIMPSLAEKITNDKLTTYEAARRFVSADKVADLTPEELGKASVVASFTQAHWKSLAENPKVSAEQMTAAQNALKELAGGDLVKLQQDYAIAQMQIDRAKQEGMQEGDRKVKNADGLFTVVKGLKSLRKDLMKPLNERRDALFTKTSTVTDDDRTHYAPVISDRRMNDPKFIANFKAQYGHEPSNEELILIERGRTYKQLEDSQKQIGGLFYRPYNPQAAGTPPTIPPAPPKSVAEIMDRVKEKRTAEAATEAARGEAERAAAGTGGFLGEISEAEERVAAAKEERIAAEREKNRDDGDRDLPPPSLPGTRPPTPPPTRPSTPTPARPATPPPPAQPTQVPPRAPTPPPQRPATPPPSRPSTPPPVREATVATAEQGIEAEAKRREAQEAQQKANEESATRIREESERTAEASRESAKSEEHRRKDAEKIGEAAGKEARAAEEKLSTLEASLGVTKKTEEETKKILKEMEGGAKAAEKIAELAPLNLRRQQDFIDAFMKGNINNLIGAEITTPDKRKRIVKNILRNSPNPMQSTVITENDERIDLNQLYKFAEKSNAPVEIKKK